MVLGTWQVSWTFFPSTRGGFGDAGETPHFLGGLLPPQTHQFFLKGAFGTFISPPLFFSIPSFLRGRFGVWDVGGGQNNKFCDIRVQQPPQTSFVRKRQAKNKTDAITIQLVSDQGLRFQNVMGLMKFQRVVKFQFHEI